MRITLPSGSATLKLAGPPYPEIVVESDHRECGIAEEYPGNRVPFQVVNGNAPWMAGIDKAIVVSNCEHVLI